MSVQEAAYLCLVELWPRKCQPGVLYFNTNIPNERIRLLKSEEEMLEMPEIYIQNGNYDIYKTGIIFVLLSLQLHVTKIMLMLKTRARC